MSIIGKNIKKIRTIKGYSQQVFGDLFGLSRANIGSYEEGRAEPKTSVVLEIANKFSIPLERLLHAELRVNEIAGFKHELGASMDAPAFSASVPLLRAREFDAFIAKLDQASSVSELPRIHLPWVVQGDCLAIEVMGNEMLYKGMGLYPTDVLICRRQNPGQPASLREGRIHAVVCSSGLLIRRMQFGLACFEFCADNPFYPSIHVPATEVRQLWLAVALLSQGGGCLLTRHPWAGAVWPPQEPKSSD
ncbi:MAG: helix-turn-helix domain-containing protein [Bacteroidetes bacterium]|jgi:transcriptional regulator with XRE-family HTH domain|nr:helix-turn-helix domain-containing protein [Bacteroidota bacterium]